MCVRMDTKPTGGVVIMAKKQHEPEPSMQQVDLLQRRIQTLTKWLALLVTLTLAKRFVAMILLSLDFSISPMDFGASKLLS